jgi:hypothetical protein
MPTNAPRLQHRRHGSPRVSAMIGSLPAEQEQRVHEDPHSLT